LKAGGKLDNVKGVIFGNICKPQDEAVFKKMATEILGSIKAPILYRLPAGHGGGGLTLPFGVRVKIDGAKKKIEILEPAVS
jgi:muramoyltetrapeptide carboxypeptidase LdcA involved in peptidoglycan recycling